MNQFYKIFFLFIGVLGLSINLSAQSEFGAYFLSDTWAARELNPSDSLRGNFEIYLPGTYFESHHSNSISFSDIVRNDGETATVSLSSVINQLEDSNTFENGTKVNTIGIGFKVKDFQIDVKHNFRLNSRIVYPKELAKLIFEGNSQFIGETVSFGPSVDYYAFNEYSVGISRNFGAFAIGARVKYLSGVGFVHTQNNQASLFTDDDIYQLTFNTDYSFQASNSIDIDGLRDFSFNANFTDQFFSENNGFAFDLGASYQVTKALRLSASILDLGSINWDSNTSTYTSNGDFTYDGFDLDAFLLEDDVEFEIKLDTLEEVFAFTNSASEFKTELNGKVYFAGQYELNGKVNLGGLLFTDLELDEFAFGLNAQYKIGKSSLIGLNYGYRKDNFSNFGLQFISRLGPVIIFGNTDNIISLVTTNNYSVNGRLGLGLTF